MSRLSTQLINMTQIGDVVKELGVNPRILYYWESEGLINSIRTENNYHFYDNGNVVKIQQIGILRKLGFSIPTINQLYSARDASELFRLIHADQARMFMILTCRILVSPTPICVITSSLIWAWTTTAMWIPVCLTANLSLLVLKTVFLRIVGLIMLSSTTVVLTAWKLMGLMYPRRLNFTRKIICKRRNIKW